MNYKNKFGIDTLELMVLFITCIESVSKEVFDQSLLNQRKFIEKGIGREMTNKEYLYMLKDIHSYIMSDELSDQRFKAMKNLFELNFIQ